MSEEVFKWSVVDLGAHNAPIDPLKNLNRINLWDSDTEALVEAARLQTETGVYKFTPSEIKSLSHRAGVDNYAMLCFRVSVVPG